MFTAIASAGDPSAGSVLTVARAALLQALPALSVLQESCHCVPRHLEPHHTDTYLLTMCVYI